jgi:hypothetical protein
MSGAAAKKPRSEDDGRFHASRFWWGVALSFLGAGLYRAHWPARPKVPLRSPPFEWHYISGMFTNGTLRELDLAGVRKRQGRPRGRSTKDDQGGVRPGIYAAADASLSLSLQSLAAGSLRVPSVLLAERAPQ